MKVEKEELLRKTEILLQQTVTTERTVRIRKHGFLVSETRGPQNTRRKEDRLRGGITRVPSQGRDAVIAQHFIKVMHETGLAAEVEPKRPERKLRESQVCVAPQSEVDR